MSHMSYRAWGKYRIERELIKDFEEQKKEVNAVSVFVIMNEWTGIDGNSGAEVVGSNYFESEDDAHESLVNIASSYDVELLRDETSLQLEDHTPSLQYEEFYIQELTKI